MRLETVPDQDDPGRTPPSRRAGRGARREGGLIGPDSEIGARLRALYSAVEKEPIPSDLIDLLEQLDAAEGKDGEA